MAGPPPAGLQRGAVAAAARSPIDPNPPRSRGTVRHCDRRRLRGPARDRGRGRARRPRRATGRCSARSESPSCRFRSTCGDSCRRPSSAAPSTPDLLRLLDVCVDHRRTVDADASVRAVLEQAAWVPCADDVPRRPSAVYFGTPTVRAVLGSAAPLVHRSIKAASGAADLLRALGVQNKPRPEDLIKHVQGLTAERPRQRRASARLSRSSGICTARRRTSVPTVRSELFATCHGYPSRVAARGRPR